jgi:hypothetical protein
MKLTSFLVRGFLAAAVTLLVLNLSVLGNGHLSDDALDCVLALLGMATVLVTLSRKPAKVTDFGRSFVNRDYLLYGNDRPVKLHPQTS